MKQPLSLECLPREILHTIFSEVVEIEKRESVAYTFGLQQRYQRDGTVDPRMQRYVRGPLRPEQARWQAVRNIRRVCSDWHEWALAYALRELHVRIWQGGQRWFNLTKNINEYPTYELVNGHSGAWGTQDKYSSLRSLLKLVRDTPGCAAHIQSIRFSELIEPETDRMIWLVLRALPLLLRTSVPWTLVRHGSPEDWVSLLAVSTPVPLRSLQLIMATPSSIQLSAIENESQRYLEHATNNQPHLVQASGNNDVDDSAIDTLSLSPYYSPLHSPLVSFAKLTQLHLFGSTLPQARPITDADLHAIARTAHSIEQFILTCVNSVTIDGVIAIVRASQRTLRVLEHSPREKFGFSHPHPGTVKRRPARRRSISGNTDDSEISVSGIIRESSDRIGGTRHTRSRSLVETSSDQAMGLLLGQGQVAMNALQEQQETQHSDDDTDVHVCEVLASCPNLTDLSVSLPSVCSVLFENPNVKWRGDCQVRARTLCGCGDASTTSSSKSVAKELAISKLLEAARHLIHRKASQFHSQPLTLELFYAGMIFDPHTWLVHGDFSEARERSFGAWPPVPAPALPSSASIDETMDLDPSNQQDLVAETRKTRGRGDGSCWIEHSLKGPYGSSGVYGKLEEDYRFDMMEEASFLAGVGRGFVTLT